MKQAFKNIGVRVSIITVIINFLLFVIKFVAGIISHSHAIISDAFHSLSDVVTTIAVIFGLVLSFKEPDKNHPYGHERIESMIAIILAFILLISGVWIGYMGFKAILLSKTNTVIPGISALVAALISIVVKEGMYHYTIKIAKKINSASMEADAWHHRSDALSSIGSFLGILGSRLGFPILDPLCSVLICILIIKTAIEIFITASNQLLDTACDDVTNKKIVDAIYDIYDDLKITEFKTRMFGNRCYIDVEIALNGNISLKDANAISVKIHNNLEDKFPLIKHCNIHVIPFEE